MSTVHAEGSATIAADAVALYDLLSDLTAMGRWSPEATGGRWVGGATGPSVGAKFRGHNKSGWRRWSTSAKIETADRGKRFAFRVTVGGFAVSEWSYDFSPDGDATRVVERWTDLRSRWMNLRSRPVMGVYDRAGHNEQNIVATLTALKASVNRTRPRRSRR